MGLIQGDWSNSSFRENSLFRPSEAENSKIHVHFPMRKIIVTGAKLLKLPLEGYSVRVHPKFSSMHNMHEVDKFAFLTTENVLDPSESTL